MSQCALSILLRMNSLIIFGFSLLALGSCFPHSKELSEQDKEVLLEADRNLTKLEESLYQWTNASVIDLYRSIVKHNIADKSIIQEAKDYLNKWENETEKYPPFSYFLRLLKTKEPEEIDEWNLWTDGLFEIINDKLNKIIGQSLSLCEEILQTTLNKVSDSTFALLLKELGDQYGPYDINYTLNNAVFYRNIFKLITLN